MSAHDLDVVVAMVAPDAVLHDPVDRAGLKGFEKIRAFFADRIDAIRTSKLSWVRLELSEAVVAVSMRLSGWSFEVDCIARLMLSRQCAIHRRICTMP